MSWRLSPGHYPKMSNYSHGMEMMNVSARKFGTKNLRNWCVLFSKCCLETLGHTTIILLTVRALSGRTVIVTTVKLHAPRPIGFLVALPTSHSMNCTPASVDPKQFKQIQNETCDLVKYTCWKVWVIFFPSVHLFLKRVKGS